MTWEFPWFLLCHVITTSCRTSKALCLWSEENVYFYVHMTASLFAHEWRYWVCVGWRFVLSQWLVIQTDVVHRPHCVIWHRCRWRLCSQTLSWKLLLPPNPYRYCFSFDFGSGGSHKDWISGSQWLASWMVWGDLSKPWSLVWRGAGNKPAYCLALWFPSGYTLFCAFAKACLSLFCYFPSGDDAWCLTKKWATQSGGNRKDNLKDDHG